MASKYYVVWEGRQKGVFSQWAACKESIFGYTGAVYKSYDSFEKAKEAYESMQTKDFYKQIHASKQLQSHTTIIKDSIAVDAACSGNPGDMEYQGVYVKTGQQLFHVGPLAEGTNNIGEFLAIVHGLAFLQKKQMQLPIYTDSVTALSWIKKKQCNTKLDRTRNNTEIFNLITRAEQWLKSNTYSVPLLKWDTKHWGEIPADFGRK